ncbi:hypothetical protein SDC9_56524 [bioreactor metagenome]|uniref:Uncharacterized protein n=1 Tax=bioreactor metagenome TaxID=1076179 RepID=A0A644X2K8_9ZZZZ
MEYAIWTGSITNAAADAFFVIDFHGMVPRMIQLVTGFDGFLGTVMDT